MQRDRQGEREIEIQIIWYVHCNVMVMNSLYCVLSAGMNSDHASYESITKSESRKVTQMKVPWDIYLS